MNGSLETRAGHAEGSLATGSMGLYFTTAGTTNTKYLATNREVRYENTVWAIQGSELYWLDATSTVTYQAYHPFGEVSNPATYNVVTPADQSTPEAAKQADFLYTSGSTTYGNTQNGVLALNFDHKMVLLKVKLATPETESIDSYTFDAVRVVDVKLERSFDLTSGKWNAEASSAAIASATMLKEDATTFECILVPQTIYKIRINATTVDGSVKTFTYNNPNGIALAEGSTNTLTLTLSANRTDVTMTANVKAWGEGGKNETGTSEEMPVLHLSKVGELARLTAENLSEALSADGTLTLSGQTDATDLSYLGAWAKGLTADSRKLVSLNMSALTVEGNAIPDEFMRGYSYLTEVIMPTGVETIGGYAFQNCTGLTYANLSGVKTLECGVFYGCTKLVSVNVPELTSIGEYAFQSTTLKGLDAPKVISLGTYAFSSATLSGIINLPSCSSIENYVFQNITSEFTLKLTTLEDMSIYNDYHYANVFSASYITLYLNENKKDEVTGKAWQGYTFKDIKFEK